jgi:ABC-type Fe3+-hydroxamate transport system substrate-binding protein
MQTYTDQLGNSIHLKQRPKRIISLVPSQSEFLWQIGAEPELVGITKFCIHPEKMFGSVQKVGGTKKLSLEKIRQLNPDLIIGNKEENDRSQIEMLQKEFPVWMSDICTFENAFKMMEDLGVILERESEARSMVTSIKESLSRIKNIFSKQTVAYFIWNEPYMFAAKDTFIDHVLNHIGLENALSHLKRYPQLSSEGLQGLEPDYCFLSSEPFPFKEEHVKKLQEKLPEAKIRIVDGEVFSWYGSRMLHLKKYIEELHTGITR